MGERRLKVSDVVRDTGLARGTVDGLYQGTATRVDLKTVETLCRYLGVGVAEMFELVEGD